MRRVVLALLGSTIGTALLVGLKAQGAQPGVDAVATAPPAPSVSGVAGSASPSRPAMSPSATRPAPATTSSATTSSATTTRTILGGAYPAKDFGNVQVKVIMTGNRIVDIKVVQMSNRPLNAPTLLRREALAKQSAKLTNVSGATYTCQAYMRSLQSALDKA